MAKAVSKLSIQVSANTMAVTKGFERVNKSAKRLKGNLRGGAGGKGGLLGGAGAAGLARLVPILAGVATAMVAIRAAARGIGEAVARIDNLAKTSATLGMTANALNGLRNAANKTGVSTSELDKGLEKMSKGISESGIGIGEAKRSFDELGLSYEDLAALTPDEAFLKISAAMEGVEIHSDKTRHAMAIFGRAGAGLINTMAAGEEGLKNYMSEAERLNGVLAGDAAVFEEFSDVSDDVKKAFEGLWQELGVLLLPALTTLLGLFTDIVVAAKEVFRVFSGRGGGMSAVAKEQERVAMLEKQRRARAALQARHATEEAKKQAKEKADAEIAAAERIKRQQEDMKAKLLGSLVDPVLAQARAGVGAVTRGSVAGFSAVQRGREAARTAIEQRKQLIQHAEKRRKILEQIERNTQPSNSIKVQQVALAP